MGSGLSSSAALEVSVAYALLTISMRRCRRSRSHSRVSVQRTNSSAPAAASWTSSLRPTASLAARSCSTARTTPGRLRRCRRRIVGSSANTMVKHSVAHGEYNVRRAESEELVELRRRRIPQRSSIGGAQRCRDERADGRLCRRRSRAGCGISSARTVACTRRMRRSTSGNVARLGQLLFASHESLRQGLRSELSRARSARGDRDAACRASSVRA